MMNWSILLTIGFMCVFSFGTVQVDVCNPETLDLYHGTEVMVGSRLSLVVSSDNSNMWSGGFFVEGENRSLGLLAGRAQDPNSRDWTQSHLPAAGLGAQVIEWKDSIRWGFDLYTDDLARQTGKWFVLDYQALKPGPCRVLFYDYNRSWSDSDPNRSVTFYNVPTRDLVADGIVNYMDFSVFSSHWLTDTGTNDPNLLSPADFNLDGSVDFADVCLFADFWMYGVAGWQPQEDTLPPPLNEPPSGITYSITDANALSEITLEVGQSITLYINLATDDENVYILDVETQISDPNLGSIDNTPIDPNNPPGPGTARLLFEPRIYSFDYWGPGAMQPEGIEFIGIEINTPIADGAAASFVYTAEAEGTVELTLSDYVSYSNLQKLVIRQTAGDEMTMMESSLETMDLTTSSAEPSGLSETTAVSAEPSAVSDTTAAAESVTTETVDAEQLADFLEDLYVTEDVLQQDYDPATWQEFVEEVRSSEQ